MVISQSDNKFYAKVLDDLRVHSFSHVTNKKLREHIKDLNPNYPIDQTTGKYKSFAKISVLEFREHLSFLKIIACKYGMKAEYFDQLDIDIAKEKHFKTRVVKSEEVGGEFNIVFVLCSRCGSSTKRGLSRGRLQELMDIEEGNRVETLDPIDKSFICAHCMKHTKE